MSAKTISNNKLIINLFVALFAFVAIGCGDDTATTAPYSFTTTEKEQLLSGDIIMRRGEGIVSDMIVNSFKEPRPISHCGIICRQGDSLYVIHSISAQFADSDGIQSCSIDEFVRIAIPNSVLVTRFKSNDSANQKLATFANRYLQKNLKFDYQFDSKDSSRIFCSELVRDAILSTHGIDLFKDSNLGNLGFQSFYDPHYFNLIIDHHRRVIN